MIGIPGGGEVKRQRTDDLAVLLTHPGVTATAGAFKPRDSREIICLERGHVRHTANHYLPRNRNTRPPGGKIGIYLAGTVRALPLPGPGRQQALLAFHVGALKDLLGVFHAVLFEDRLVVYDAHREQLVDVRYPGLPAGRLVRAGLRADDEP